MAGEDSKRKRYEEWLMPLIAEFIAVIFFAFMHCMGRASLPVLDAAIINGFYVLILVITIGHISGAHMNAAVTLAIALCGGVKWALAPLYIIMQLIGSVIGALIARVALGAPSGAFFLGEGVSIGQGVLTEVMMTTLLVFVILQTALDIPSTNAPFAIGFSIVINALIGVKITGACTNPSLSFGAAIVSGAWDNYWIYWVAPTVGALIAVAIHKLALATAKNRIPYRGDGDGYDDLSSRP